MRKILIIIIIILLLCLGYITLIKGIKIADFKILSVKGIEEESQNLKSKIEEINNLIDVEYPKKMTELKKASSNMEESKSKYLKYTNLSSDKEILAAMQKKSYTIEFLWAKVGTHARKEGINLKFEIISSSSGASNSNDIKFTADGSYIAITNFIYALENDTDLNFRIENFKLLPYENEILQATFYVRNITIEGNTSQENVKNATTNTSQGNTNSETTNTSEENTNSETTDTIDNTTTTNSQEDNSNVN